MLSRTTSPTREEKKNTNSIMLLATVLSLFLVSEVSLARDLTIAAFNVQIFGQKKANDAFIMETLVKVYNALFNTCMSFQTIASTSIT